MPQQYRRQMLLSQAEKEQVVNRYRELVESMNAKLPKDQQIKLDVKSIIAKCDDPDEIIPYRAGMFLNNKREKQDAAFEELKRKYPYNVKDYGFKIQRYFSEKNTEAAKQYNEQIYKAFVKDPEKFMNRTFSQLVHFEPDDIYTSSKADLANYYYGNFGMVENAPALSNYLKNNPDVLPEVKEKAKTITTFTKGLDYLPAMSKKVTSIDYLACPKLTQQQAQILGDAYGVDSSNDIANIIHDLSDKEKPLPPKEYYKSVGLDQFIESNTLDSPALKVDFVKTTNIGGKPVNTNVSVAEYVQNKDNENENVSYQIVADEEKEFDYVEQNTITKASRQSVIDEFGKALHEELGLKGKYDPKKIEDRYKGNVFERIGNTTSDEYKELIQAIKDYSDPTSPNYLNYDNMYDAAGDYLDHKTEQGYITAGVTFDWEGNDVDQNPQEAYRLMIAAERHQELNFHAQGVKAKELSGTSLERAKLAQAIRSLKGKISNIHMNTVGQTIEKMANTDNTVGLPVNLNAVLEQDKSYEEDVVAEENALIEKNEARRDVSNEMAFPVEYDLGESLEKDGQKLPFPEEENNLGK